MFDEKGYLKKYYQNNKEKIIARSMRWQKDNPEKANGYTRKWAKNNPVYHRKWLKTEKGKANNQRGSFKRRTRKREIINTLTAEEWLNILKQHNFRCAYCGKNLFTLFTRPERDHIIPINKGGNNTKENIVPACRGCNAKKHNKILV